MRAAVLLDTDPAAAASKALEILEIAPGHAAATLLLGNARRHCGDAVAAIGVFEGIAATHPQSAVIQLELGRAAVAAGRDRAALAAFERAVQLEPDLADAWRELSGEFAARGDVAMCDATYARYEQLAPADNHLRDAQEAFATRRFAAAVSLLRRELARSPRDVAAMCLLAEVLTAQEDYQEAARILTACLELAPGCGRARFDFALVLHSQQKPGPMLPLIERLLVQEPASLPYRSLKASALTLLGQTDQSIEVLAALLAEHPTNEHLWMNYGHALRAAGRNADAIEAYRHSIRVRPEHGEAYFSLANLKTFRFEAAEVAVMRAQLGRADLQESDAVQLEFALGKALEDTREFAESFSHYARGNALRRSDVQYDADNSSRQMQRQRALYTKQFFAARAGWGAPAPDPVFIVGLPRSGSTLLEQILASHSQVEGTRELPDIPEIAYELGGQLVRLAETAYPESVAALTRDQVSALGERYLGQTRAHRLLAKAQFIDKMPSNFMHLGLIHLMLPNARIIDARRHPLGCCFSNFKQHFQLGLHFTNSLAEIGRFYRDYVELMGHFDAVQPGRVHRVFYEHLVAEPEHEVRRLLDYCRLPFEAACLRFHETRRVVQTASSEQVRQPIYSEGVDQWRNYESWLEPLKTVLGALATDYPSARVPVK